MLPTTTTVLSTDVETGRGLRRRRATCSPCDALKAAVGYQPVPNVCHYKVGRVRVCVCGRGCGRGRGASTAARLRTCVFATSSSASHHHPTTTAQQTLPKAWTALRSRWRYAHASTFALGPPLHLLSRIYPPLAANMGMFALISLDHILNAATALSPSTAKHRSIFPPLSASVASSLDPAYRLALFAVALLLTLRLGRVYERWWAARSAFSALGSACVQAASRAAAWGGDEATVDEVARWAVAWHFR